MKRSGWGGALAMGVALLVLAGCGGGRLSEQECMERAMYFESNRSSRDGMVAVGSVVMNRVRSQAYPNSVSGVIYQGGQFSPVASGRLATVLGSGLTSASCSQAAQEVLNGNITNGYLHFRQNNGVIEGSVIGNHVFY